MNDSGIAIHEYHCIGGPLTYEYPVGHPISSEHNKYLSPFVRELAAQSVEAIRMRLEKKWSSLPAAVNPLSKYLLSLDIQSVAVIISEEQLFDSSWVVMRGESSQQCMIGAAKAPGNAIRSSRWIKRVDGLLDLIREFGNLQVGMIPPCSGFYVSERLIHESDNELCWGPTGPWENALPVFHDGSGNSICVSSTGTVGIWSPHQFQQIADCLGDFITMFVRRQQTGQSPEHEWWW